jgi:hypothetical protein
MNQIYENMGKSKYKNKLNEAVENKVVSQVLFTVIKTSMKVFLRKPFLIAINGTAQHYETKNYISLKIITSPHFTFIFTITLN